MVYDQRPLWKARPRRRSGIGLFGASRCCVRCGQKIACERCAILGQADGSGFPALIREAVEVDEKPNLIGLQ
jgi:hypothetical protein